MRTPRAIKVEADAQLEVARQGIRERLFAVKTEVVAAVEAQFRRTEEEWMGRLEALPYVKQLGRFKELSKRTLLALKHAERHFLAEEGKIMRMLIKYQAGQIHGLLEEFAQQAQEFLQPLPAQLYSLNFTEQIAAAPLQLLSSALRL